MSDDKDGTEGAGVLDRGSMSESELEYIDALTAKLAAAEREREQLAHSLAATQREWHDQATRLGALLRSVSVQRDAEVRKHAEARAEVERLRTALRKIRDNEDHDKYCDSCRVREAIAEGTLDEAATYAIAETWRKSFIKACDERDAAQLGCAAGAALSAGIKKDLDVAITLLTRWIEPMETQEPMDPGEYEQVQLDTIAALDAFAKDYGSLPTGMTTRLAMVQREKSTFLDHVSKQCSHHLCKATKALYEKYGCTNQKCPRDFESPVQSSEAAPGEKCRTCEGRGKITYARDADPWMHLPSPQCPDCNGTGKRPAKEET